MNFEQRARKARDRGQQVRSAVLLIEGLKRNPKARSALELLIDIYANDLDSAGLGYDLKSVVASQPDARSIYEDLLERLHAQQKESMGQELVNAAAEDGIELTWPPPVNAAAAKTPEPHASTLDAPDHEVPEPDHEEPEPDHDVPEPERLTPETPTTEGLEPQAVPDEPKPAREESKDVPEVDEERPSDSEPAIEPNEAPTPVDDRDTASSKPASSKPASSKPASSKPVASKPAASKTNAATGEEKKPQESRTRQPQNLRAIVVIAFVLVGVAGYFWWAIGPQSGSVEQADLQIERIDPTDKAQIEAVFSNGASVGQLSTPLAERRAFLHAVGAAERGEASATIESEETVWGIAAAAVSYALQSKFEQSLSAAARLERQHPTALASHWALGFVAEARGRFAVAMRHYQAGEERFPDFAPMITGQLRVHTRQGRATSVEELQTRLSEHHAKNPYADMPPVIPDLDDLAPRENAQEAQRTPKTDKGAGKASPHEAQPRFVRAVQKLRRSLDAVHRGKPSLALEHADKALELEPELGPALLVAGALRIASMDLENAMSAFRRLAQLPGLDMRYRWTLQVAAPRALIAVGRADLAYQFVPPVKGAGNVAPRDLDNGGRALPEPLVPMLSVETRAESEPLAQQALLARADVLSLLGFASAATETLGLLDGVDAVAPEVGLRRALTAIRRGSRRSASAAVRALGEHPRGLTAGAALAYYSGRYDDAIDLARRARVQNDGPDDTTTLRYLTLSLAADGRGREAMFVLDKARVRVFDQPHIDALRMRVLGRLAPRDKSSTATYETFEKLSVTSIDRLMDLADVAFWHKNFDDAHTWIKEVLAMAPALPEANWLRGLLAQVADKEHDAERYFRDAWRDGTDDPRLLIELGHIYLGLGEAKRAQAVFYRALLKQRTSVDAIRGLGQAYLAYSPRVGHRDLSRILRSYTGSTSFVAQATATLKWLAILNGSRQGDAKALKFLDQASTLMGDSADLLIERARFHEARDEVGEARDRYARALEKNATLADARAGLARMALEQGDDDVARIQLERYLTLAPDGEHAKWAREQLAASKEASSDQE